MDARQKINRAMADADGKLLELRYLDAKGNRSRRVVSPVRWLRSGLGFTALCLGREECRTFRLDRCESIELRNAADFVMPVAIAETPQNDSG